MSLRLEVKFPDGKRRQRTFDDPPKWASKPDGWLAKSVVETQQDGDTVVVQLEPTKANSPKVSRLLDD